MRSYNQFLNIKYCFFSFFLFVFNSIWANPNDPYIRNIGVDEGLSHYFVTDILQDSRGYIWISTLNGINRLNGNSIANYYAQPSVKGGLKNDRITSICEGPYGNIWAGSEFGGVQVLNIETNVFVNIKLDHNNVFNNVIHSIVKLSNGDILCGTRAGELYRFKLNDINGILSGEPAKFEKLNLSFSKEKIDLDRIIQISEGVNEVWLIDWKRRLFRIDYTNTKTSTYYINLVETDNLSFSKVKKDDKDTMFFCTTNGVFTINATKKGRSTIQNWKKIPLTNNLNVTGIALYEGNIILTDYKKGVFQISDVYKENPKLSSFYVDHMRLRVQMVDNSNVLWLSSPNLGVFNFELSFKNFNKLENINTIFKDRITPNIVASLLDSNNYLWTGFNNGEIEVYDNEKKKIIYKKNNIFPKNIFEDQYKQVWISTRRGMFVFNPQKNKIPSLEHIDKLDFAKWGYENAENKYFNYVSEDLYGNTWVASDRGLMYIKRSDDGGIESIKKIEIDNNNQFSGCDIQMVKTYPGKSQLWILQRSCGLTIMNYDETLENVSFDIFSNEKKGYACLKSNTVNNIYINADAIWLCTDNGLKKLVFSEKEQDYIVSDFFNEKSSLTNSLVNSIEKDNDGNIWIGTNNGLSFLDVKTNKIRTYTIKDGLISNVFTNVSFKRKDGSLVFGTVKGYVSFSPNEIEFNSTIPQASFTLLSVFNKKIKPGEMVNGSVILTKVIEEMDEITINYKQNDFAIGLSSLHYAIPEKNQFAYKLEGYHDDWIIKNSSNPVAYFSNLLPGSYTLKLKTSNNDGIWTPNPKLLKIDVLPPPWKTTWAFILYGVLIVAFIYLITNIWESRIKLRNEIRLQISKREKQTELNEIKLRHFTNISHEFRTPLTLIHGPVLELIDLFKKDSKIYSILLPLNLNINRMIRLVNQLLDFRKAEYNNLKLHLSKGDVISLLKSIKTSYSEMAHSKHIHLEIKTDRKEFITWFDEDKLEKIVHNLMSNALKYTDQGGRVIIAFKSLKNNEIVISVSDTGKGISEKNKQNIFERFFQEGNYESKGTGIGLALVKKLVEMHKGVITVESTLGKGSSFTVTIPVGEESFFDQIQNQIAKEGIDNIPVWISGEYEEEKFEDTISQKEELPLILIVEDENDIREYLKHLLSDFRTIVANNGKEGAESAKKFLPDMIISDISMPEINGIEMCKTLKTDIDTSHIPIIFLTAKASESEKIEGLNIGAADYFIKPFDPNEFKIKIENHLNDLRKNKDRLKRDFILSPSAIKIESPEEMFLQKAVKIVEDNMNDGNFNLLFFCEQLGVSRMQLHRKLKMFTGQSTTEFIRSIRLKRAAQLLKTGHLTVIEVMYEIGMESSSYFSKAFKKQYGTTPSEYSKK